MAKPQLPATVPGARLLAARKLVDRLSGARLCFGEPVKVGDRAIVPVGRVSAVGGAGWGSGDDGAGAATGAGGGGGGTFTASPVGFIDIGPEGARFEAIPDPDRPMKLLRAGATAAVTLMGAVAVRRSGRRGVRALLARRT